MSVHKKLMQARVKLQSVEMKKSGKNAYQGYSYFELGDFIPHIQTIFNELGLCGVVSFNTEYAQLCITDVDDGTVIVITSPMAEASLKGAQPIQLMGSIQTYQRRYLWMAAMELTEHDSIDSAPPVEAVKDAPKPEPKPSPVQELKAPTKHVKGKVDHQPDCLETHLPDYRVKDVWRKYVNETHSKESKHHFSDHVSEMNFRKMLDDDLPYIKVRKVKRFAKCDTCTKLRDAIDKCMGDRREKLKEELHEHIEWQFRERDKYYKHRFKARRFPSRYMTMSLDGMDNGKTAIPRRSREDKTSDANFRLGVHLTGVLMHGRKNPIHAYTWYDQFPTGSDSVVTIICHALRKTQEDGPLPPVLYLHLDNCGRENKNRSRKQNKFKNDYMFYVCQKCLPL